jgi:hypothetical protein
MSKKLMLIAATIALCVITSGCKTVPPTHPKLRTFASVTPQELEVIRRERRDVILLNEPSEPTDIRIPMTGIDARDGLLHIYELDLCTGILYDLSGTKVLEYGGDGWGGDDC